LSLWFSIVSDRFELFFEIGGQFRRRLVEITGGVVEQVAQQQFCDGIGAEVFADEQRVKDEAARAEFVGGGVDDRGVAPTGDTPRDAAGTTPEALSSSPATNAAGVSHFKPPCGRLWL